MARYRNLLAYFIFTSCTVAGQSPKYALKGQEVHLKPVITGQPDEILWKHDGNKVVEFNGNEEQKYSPYENRITLDWVTAELHITHLTYEDSGEYVLEAYVNKMLRTLTFKLEVIDKVVKPTLICEMNEGNSSQATLMCSADPRRPQALMKFEWSSGGNVQSGPNLTISLGGELDDEVYSCGVSNPLTSETATFTAKDCYPDKSSSAAPTAALVSLVIIALLIVVSAVAFCKLRHKACFAKEKKNDLETAPPRSPKGSDENTAQGDESSPLLGRPPTLPSTQHLVQEHDMVSEDEKPQRGHVKKMTQKIEQNSGGQALPQKQTVADQHREPAEKKTTHSDPSDSKMANEADPAGALGDSSENTQSDLESSTAPERPESENEADEEPKSSPANGVSPPAAQPRSPLTQNSPNMAPTDISGEHEEDANSERDMVSQDEKPQKVFPGHVKSIKQKIEQNNGGQALPQNPTDLQNKRRSTKILARNNKCDPVADQHREPAEKKTTQSDPSDSKMANEADPAGALGDSSENTQSDLESSTAPERPESENEADEEPKSSPANGVSPPAAQPRSPLTQNSPNMAPTDISGEHEEDANSERDMVSQDEKPQKVFPGHVKSIKQKIEQNNGGQALPQNPTDLQNKRRSTKILARNNKCDPVADQHRKPAEKKTTQSDPSDSKMANEADPAGALGDSSENTQSDLESSTAPERPESENEADEEPKSSPANGVSPPAAQPRSPLTQNSPNMAPTDISGEHEEDANSERDMVSQDEKPQKVFPGYVKSIKRKIEQNNGGQALPQKLTEREADEDEEAKTKSSLNMAPKDADGEQEEESDSDQTTGKTVREDSTEEKQSSTFPKQEDSETSVQERDSN